MTVITDERCTEYSKRGHPERPARISKTIEKVRSQTELKINWSAPAAVDEELILRAHTKEHFAAVKRAEEDFDGDTPTYPGIFEHAQRSVGGALEAMRRARKGEMAFSLMRPPGHHATRDRAMGFCYFSSIAIAAFEALTMGATNVAIYDFDVHHGNGTEDILLNHPHTAFCSIHQHPLYPGTGASNRGQNCFNFPVPAALPREEYRKILSKALEQLKSFKPDLIGVSAGFDCYARDPLAQETLEAEDFYWLGEQLRKTNIPVFSVLEGGYSSDLPELIFEYMRGLTG
jgi:acetoin utilization deacetylase AcuC-like enzyme